MSIVFAFDKINLSFNIRGWHNAL